MTRSTTLASAALGAALALAIIVASPIMPALAAEPTSAGQAGELRMLTADTPSTLWLFQPDVRVRFLGRSATGTTVTYRFRVDNIGAASASNVKLEKLVFHTLKTGPNSSQVTSTLQVATIPSLGADQGIDVNLTCKANSSGVCSSARVEAQLADDLDPSNNKAVSK